MSLTDPPPSFHLLIPGPWGAAAGVLSVLAKRGVEASVASGEPAAAGTISLELISEQELEAGFRASRLGTTEADLLEGIAGCSTALLVELALDFSEARPTLLALSRALRDAGGLAVRMEASGCTWSWDAWLEKLESPDPEALYECATLTLRDGDLVYTRGMRCFGLPDAQISMVDDGAAMYWLDTFCVFQLAEQPVLGSGHTFRPDVDSLRRAFERWPDHRHRSSDGRHNPFGLWRFLEVGVKGISAGDPVLKLIPSLTALLIAAERSAGRALSQSEVEKLVAGATAVAMDLAASNSLDRSRGYADIDPELAWEQWQIVREMG